MLPRAAMFLRESSINSNSNDNNTTTDEGPRNQTSLWHFCHERSLGNASVHPEHPDFLGLDLPAADFADVVRCHWTDFRRPGPVWYYSVGVALALIGVFGVTANLTYLFGAFRSKSIRRSSDKLIISLAVADAINMVKIPIFVANCFAKYPVMGRSGAQVFGFLSMVAGEASIWSIVAVTYERHRVISHGINGYTKRLTATESNLMILFIWTLSLSLSLAPLAGWSAYVYEGMLVSATIDVMGWGEDGSPTPTFESISLPLLLLLVSWLVPMVLVVACNASIVVSIRANNREMLDMMEREDVRELLQRIERGRVQQQAGTATTAVQQHLLAEPNGHCFDRHARHSSSWSGRSLYKQPRNGNNNNKGGGSSSVSAQPQAVPIPPEAPPPAVGAVIDGLNIEVDAATAATAAARSNRSCLFLDDRMRTEYRLARRIKAMVICWVVAWTPYAAVFLAGTIPATRPYVTPLLSTLPGIFSKLSSAVNPLLYGHRWGINKRLRPTKIEKRSQHSTNETTVQK